MSEQPKTPLEQSIADMIQQEGADRTIVITNGLRKAAKAADEARVAMNKLFNAFRNLADDLDKMVEGK